MSKTENKVDQMHTIADDLIQEAIKKEIEASEFPTILAMIYNRVGQILAVPALAVAEESVERLRAFQDLKNIQEGKMPQNGTLNSLLEKDSKEAKIEDLSTGNITIPEALLLTEEGLPIANEATWANQ